MATHCSHSGWRGGSRRREGPTRWRTRRRARASPRGPSKCRSGHQWVHWAGWLFASSASLAPRANIGKLPKVCGDRRPSALPILAPFSAAGGRGGALETCLGKPALRHRSRYLLGGGRGGRGGGGGQPPPLTSAAAGETPVRGHQGLPRPAAPAAEEEATSSAGGPTALRRLEAEADAVPLDLVLTRLKPLDVQPC